MPFAFVTPAPTPPTPPTVQSVTAQELAGSWFTDCYVRGGSPRRDQIGFAPDGSVTYLKTYFDDLGCTHPSFSETIGGDYRLGAAAVAGLKDTWALDVSVTSADITLFDADLMWAFRRERWCGHAFWAVDEPLPMLGDICGDEKEPEYYAGQLRPDLVHVDTTSHVPRLYFGDPSALFTDGPVGPRATGLDTDRVFKKDVP